MSKHCPEVIVLTAQASVHNLPVALAQSSVYCQRCRPAGCAFQLHSFLTLCCHRCVIWNGQTLYRESVNILDLLSNCGVSGQCVVIKFLWSGHLRSSEIHRIMLAQNGERCMNGCRGLEVVKQVWPNE